MIIKTAKRITKLLIENGADSASEEIYEYALICLFNELFIDILLLAGAYIIGAFKEMVLWILVFNSMRMNIGGFHAATPEQCGFYSVMLGLLCVLAGKLLTFRYVGISAVFIVCLGIVYKTAPILNPNHPLSEERKRRARTRGFLFLVIWGFLSFILTGIWDRGAGAVVLGAASSCILVLLEYLRTV